MATDFNHNEYANRERERDSRWLVINNKQQQEVIYLQNKLDDTQSLEILINISLLITYHILLYIVNNSLNR